MSKYTAPFLYIIPSGLKISHTASIIPAKAKFTARKLPPARRNSLNVCMLNAVKSIAVKHAMRRKTERTAFNSGTRIISEYTAPMADESNMRHLRAGVLIKSSAAESSRKFISRFISRSMST